MLPAGPEKHLPSFLFFIGLAGAGKSFCAETIAQTLGYQCYDLEDDLTPAILNAIQEKRTFTDEMRDEYFEIVCRRLNELRKLHPRLAVSQAAYRDRHRQLVKRAHPDVSFIWVQAPRELIVERLTSRGDFVTPEYAALMERNFEPPTDAEILKNDRISKDELVARFLALF